MDQGKDYQEPDTRPGPRDARELEEWLKLAGDSALNLLRLAKAELALTMAELPQLVVLALVLVPFALFAWLSFSVLIAWFAYAGSGQPAWGIVTFFLLQAVPAFLLVLKITRIERSLFFPKTREQLDRLSAFLRNDSSQ